MSSTVYAADLIPKTVVEDSKSDHIGGYQFDIGSMSAELIADGTMQVDIYTHFGNFNNRISSGGSRDIDGSGNGFNNNIVFGDLLIGSTGGAFDYAFKLNDAARFKDYMNPVIGTKIVDPAGSLYAINGTTSASQYHGGGGVQSGPVMGNNTGSALSSGILSVTTGYKSDGYDKISFIFNVGNIFQNTDQISLSWAMSCFNDAVQGVFDVTHTPGAPQVPEPATVLIMLLALAILVYSRRESAATFKA